jgi:RNA recognition motif-containing protein
MTDAVSGQSRGYGFVRFSDEADQQRALVEMQGVYCGNRPMRISTATPKNNRYVNRTLTLLPPNLALWNLSEASLLGVISEVYLPIPC